MYGKLNISDILKGHISSFKGFNGKVTLRDKIAFLLIPVIVSVIIGILNVPNDNIKNVLAICLSILIGLQLNLLILVLTNLSSENTKLSNIDKRKRMELIKETFYNISFSVILSTISLLVLFSMDILFIKNSDLINFIYILININGNDLIQCLLGILLYFLSIQIFLLLFMIIKRIGKIFSTDIDLELKKINKQS